MALTKPSERKPMADEESPTAAEGAEQPQGGAPEPAANLPEKVKPAGGGGGAVTRPPAAKGGPGFFSIYKKGQGYWTRMGTAIAAILIGAFTAYNFYVYIPTMLPTSPTPQGLTVAEETAFTNHQQTLHTQIGVGVAVGFLLAYSFIAWRLMNKPSNVDFLIATDSEMKKVNWTSMKELVGSTKVVILFMFLTAIFLFVVDILFGYMMNLIHVLKQGPLG